MYFWGGGVGGGGEREVGEAYPKGLASEIWRTIKRVNVTVTGKEAEVSQTIPRHAEHMHSRKRKHHPLSYTIYRLM